MDSQLDFGKNLQDEGAIITTYNHMLPSPSKIKNVAIRVLFADLGPSPRKIYSNCTERNNDQ